MMNFIKYNLIGLINTLIHWSIYFYSLYELNFSSTISNVIGFLFAATGSYIFNSKFNYNQEINTIRYIKFLFIMSILAYTIALIFQSQELSHFIMLITYTLTSVILGFFLTKYWVFKK